MDPSNSDYLTVAFAELKQRVIRLEAWQRERDEAVEARLRDRDKKKLIAQGAREAAKLCRHSYPDHAAILAYADSLDPP